MFESAASMSSEQLLSVAYYTRIALEHRFTPEDLRQYPLLEDSSGEPSPEEQDLACLWLEEIERYENRPINQLDFKTLDRYAGQLSSMVLDRDDLESGPVDPEEAQRLLEELRRAVPLPSELRKAG